MVEYEAAADFIFVAFVALAFEERREGAAVDSLVIFVAAGVAGVAGDLELGPDLGSSDHHGSDGDEGTYKFGLEVSDCEDFGFGLRASDDEELAKIGGREVTICGVVRAVISCVDRLGLARDSFRAGG